MNKRVVKLITRIISPIIICGAFIGTWLSFSFLVINDSSSYTRVMMHEFYNQNKIDSVFCGASLCYRSFDTEILDEELNQNTFNLGSSSQTIDVTYYLIKDALSRYDVKDVYLELSPIMASYYSDNLEQREMTGVYLISDYMKWSPNKIELLLEASTVEDYSNSFSITRRNWKNIFKEEYAKNAIEAKSSEAYKEYRYDYLIHEKEWYKGKGYVECSERKIEGLFNDRYISYKEKLKSVNSKFYDYLERIITLCKRNNTDIHLLCTPLSEYLLAYYGNDYDSYHNSIKSIADDHGVNFFDFSLIKKEFLDINASDYMDSAHLNMYGARLFSHSVANLIKNKDYKDEAFYKTVFDKLRSGEKRVLGLVSLDNHRIIVNNGDGQLIFQVKLITSDGEEIIQEYSANNEFDLKSGEHGIIRIYSKGIGIDEKVHNYTF